MRPIWRETVHYPLDPYPSCNYISEGMDWGSRIGFQEAQPLIPTASENSLKTRDRDVCKHPDRCSRMLYTSPYWRVYRGDFAKTQILIQWVWSKAGGFVVLKGSPSAHHTLKAQNYLHICWVWWFFQKTLRPFPTVLLWCINWVASARSNFGNIYNLFRRNILVTVRWQARNWQTKIQQDIKQCHFIVILKRWQRNLTLVYINQPIGASGFITYCFT